MLDIQFIRQNADAVRAAIKNKGFSLDLDEVFERVLVDVYGEKLVFTIGKEAVAVRPFSGPRLFSQPESFSRRLSIWMRSTP